MGEFKVTMDEWIEGLQLKSYEPNTKFCTTCGEVLELGKNWRECFKRNNKKMCSDCHNKKGVADYQKIERRIYIYIKEEQDKTILSFNLRINSYVIYFYHLVIFVVEKQKKEFI